VSFLDGNGFFPGQLFNSKEEAIIDFGLLYNPLSIFLGIEIGTRLYSVKTENGKKYSYVEPLEGDKESAPIPDSPKDVKDISTMHTHGAWDKNSKDATNRFGDKDMNIHLSDGDIYNTREDRFNLPVIGIFPNGKAEMFDPFAKDNAKLNKNIINVLLPCDVNAPGNNKNTINDVKKPIYETIEIKIE